VRLVWVVIPLVLIGIIGIEESFAEEFGEYPMSCRDADYHIPYSISNGEIMKIDDPNGSYWLEITINADDEGVLELQIPQKIIRTQNIQENILLHTIISLNHTREKIETQETINSEFISITIPFPKGNVNVKIISDIFPSFKCNIIPKITDKLQQYVDSNNTSVDVLIFMHDDVPLLYSGYFNNPSAEYVKQLEDVKKQKVGKLQEDIIIFLNNTDSTIEKQGYSNTIYANVSVKVISLLAQRNDVRQIDLNVEKTQLIIEDALKSIQAEYLELSPYQQLKKGIKSVDVLCDEGLELIIRIHNLTPSCVTSQTAEIFEGRELALRAISDAKPTPSQLGLLFEGNRYLIDGSRSYDADGDGLIEFIWMQIDNKKYPVIIEDSNTSVPSFIAPHVYEDTILKFQLQVRDGGTFKIGKPDQTSVLIKDIPIHNFPPIAKPGLMFKHSFSDINLKLLATSSQCYVTLDSYESIDPEGSYLTSFLWTQIAGFPVAVENTRQSISFKISTSNSDDIIFELTVNDGILDSKPTSIVITKEMQSNCQV